MENFEIRLNKALDLRRVTPAELCRRVGCSEGTMSNYRSGAYKPRQKRIEQIATALNVSVAWLMGADVSIDGRQQTHSIPVLGSIRAGLPQTAAENIIDYEEIPAEMERDGEYFALQIRGDSMEPRMRTGDVIIVRKQETVDNGDVAVVLINGDEATVKRYYRRESGVSLVAINPAYEPLFYTPEQVEELPVRVMGKVVELRAKF